VGEAYAPLCFSTAISRPLYTMQVRGPGARSMRVSSYFQRLDSARAIPVTVKQTLVQGGKRSVMVTEFMDKSDLRTLLGRADLAPKFAWVSHHC